jgi:thioredoxin
MSMSTIIDVNEQTFADEVERSGLPVLVEFWAPWCAPCEALARVLEGVAAELAGRARVVRINGDENPSLAERFDIQGLPTVVLFHRGAARDSAIGVRPREEYVRFVQRAAVTRLPPPLPASPTADRPRDA